jgi:hypothetical protein
MLAQKSHHAGQNDLMPMQSENRAVKSLSHVLIVAN